MHVTCPIGDIGQSALSSDHINMNVGSEHVSTTTRRREHLSYTFSEYKVNSNSSRVASFSPVCVLEACQPINPSADIYFTCDVVVHGRSPQTSSKPHAFTVSLTLLGRTLNCRMYYHVTSCALHWFVSPIPIPAPNTGFYLRFQQIWAMFCKKFYLSFRQYGFLISQVLFPVFFVILGNVVARIGTSSGGQDPIRSISLENSALFTNNITLFHAQFGSLNVDDSSELFSVCIASMYKD